MPCWVPRLENDWHEAHPITNRHSGPEVCISKWISSALLGRFYTFSHVLHIIQASCTKSEEQKQNDYCSFKQFKALYRAVFVSFRSRARACPGSLQKVYVHFRKHEMDPWVINTAWLNALYMHVYCIYLFIYLFGSVNLAPFSRKACDRLAKSASLANIAIAFL